MISPLLYEINTRCWLKELSRNAGGEITLANIPESELLTWQQLGFTHIWLMGVWAGGPRARTQALAGPDLRRAYAQALPDWAEQDVGASPYSISNYQVPELLGGNDGLARFRQRLQSVGLKLVLDFVPNHLGLDHPWVSSRPELFVQDRQERPETFSQTTPSGTRHLAYGKDPNWPAWADTVQLDYRKSSTRQAMTDQLLHVAQMCDGVRCDMAMLLLNDVFAQTWKSFPIEAPPPRTEFWADAISVTRRARPDFLFLAEVYWGLEPRLQALGFDFTYDKALYDKLVFWEPGAVQRHLLGLGSARVAASAHFLENHDEPRIASRLPLAPHRAAALVILGLPGMRFLQDGQLSGARTRIPVQLTRRPLEPVDVGIAQMYEQLLHTLRGSKVGQGLAELLVPRSAWQDNPTAQHFILVQWLAGSVFDLVAVNLAPHHSQCYAPLKLPAKPALWKARDLLGDQTFERRSEDLEQRGLYLDLPAHGAQVLRFEPGPQ